MKIHWLEEAIIDLQALRKYIALDKPIAATNLAEKIVKATEILSNHPLIGRPGRIPETRELVISGTPYIIPYQIKQNTVEILRVYHSAMQWPEEP